MIVVTGGLGFIGKNLVNKLEAVSNSKKICVVDKRENFFSKRFIYINYLDFLEKLKNKNFLKKIEFIFHQGANSNTAEKNFHSIIYDNYFYTINLIDICERQNIPIIYASSASVYGLLPKNFKETNKMLPANYYSISKALVDIYVLNKLEKNKKIKIIGLRYFNVYGKGEERKKRMASVFHHFSNQLNKNRLIKLFKGTKGYKNGEQKRDFVNVADCVDVNIFFKKNFKSGIYNVGSGVATSFNTVARNLFSFSKIKTHIRYIDMPSDIIEGYQNFTKANINKLRKAGYKKKFISVIDGIKKLNNL